MIRRTHPDHEEELPDDLKEEMERWQQAAAEAFWRIEEELNNES